jgi:preprotein translocase subunit YajC
MQTQGDLFTTLMPLAVLFLIFYFLIIRPQKKQTQEHQNMLDNLKKGDSIITNGGLIVEVEKVEEDFIKVKLNDDTSVKMSKEYVSKKYEK